MAAKGISQKEYLKKYLSDDKKKKKKRKTNKAASERFRIVDDDIDLKNMRPLEENELELYSLAEDAPQIAGIVDERPDELRRLEEFGTKRWKVVSEENGIDNIKVTAIGNLSKDDTDTPNEKTSKKSESQHKDMNGSPVRKFNSDTSPVRKKGARSNTDGSPPRKQDPSISVNNKSKVQKESNNRSQRDSDESPPRRLKGNDSDESPPRRSKKRENSNDSLPRKHNNRETSPSRRIIIKTERDTSLPRRLKKYDSDESLPRRSRKIEADQSPPRKGRRNDDSDGSPPRRSRKMDSPKKSNNKDDSDESPPRRSRKTDSLKKSNRKDDSDESPPRKSKHPNNVHESPPRKVRRKDDSDESTPPRKSNKSGKEILSRNNSKKGQNSSSSSSRAYHSDSSRKMQDHDSPGRKSRFQETNSSDSKGARRRGSSQDSDISPPRKQKKNETSSKERTSPVRRRGSHESPPPRMSKNFRNPSPSRRAQNPSASDESPVRKPEHTTKTLDGRKAGLQEAKELKKELEDMQRKEREMFEKMDPSVSGKGAAPIMRDRKTGKRRDLEQEAKKKEVENKKLAEHKTKYTRWGKGLKQVEDQAQKLKEDLYEMTKPLARYADDVDLDRHLRDQDREGDPMLDYIRSKTTDDSSKAKPKYEGSYLPNRFGIRPGHRWDGVDRSSGYEKQWFDTMNSKKAAEEEAYKWSTSDM